LDSETEIADVRGEGCSRRKRLAKRVALLVVALMLLLVGWGTLVEPRLVDIERHDVALRDLTEQWDGAKVAYLSDLQLGMWGANVDTARKMIDRLLDEKPTLVLLGGDFLYGSDLVDEQLDTVLDLLSPLPDADIRTFAVLGNHDLDQGAGAELAGALEDAGISVLDNEASAVSAEGGSDELYVVGVGPAYGGNDDPAGAVRRVPEGAPRVVFMHNPDSFRRLPAGTAPFAVAGHTHGGQVQVPFTDWSPVDFALDVPLAGWADDFGAAGNRLYVNRGIGFSLAPIRVSCRPELTIFTLMT
jgi:predicted MPP superfamily phosphohydrolase